MALVERVMKDAGRTYSIDPEIPRSFLFGEYLRRATQLFRGIVTMRRKAFRGAGVRIMCKSNVRLGPLSTIGAGSIIDASGTRGVSLGRGAKLGRRVIVTTTSQLSKRGVGLTIGEYSGIGDHAHIGCSGGVTIGRDVIAGPYVTFHSQEHISDNVFAPIRGQGTRESEIVIEDDVWIGARATFLAGAMVRRGSIVAAGSVVRGEFPPYSVIGGVPAKVIKQRGAG